MYLGVDTSRGYFWDVHIATEIGKGERHVGKMDGILTDSTLDTRTVICILIVVVILPKLEYAREVWEGNAKFREADFTKARICKESMGREYEVRKTAENGTDDSSRKSTRMLEYDE